ncbi:uncharacterized protein [Rutidosis leptorrhynchoides]|uniref:uncharacterized protein n=1 Tax=Rutidosis leptorrhynchoides TaxID=125765 RepID=UPI003A994A6E
MLQLKAKNLALLGKWWWRFRTEPNIFWVKVIKSICGQDGGMGLSRAILASRKISTWSSILMIDSELRKLNLDFENLFIKSVSNGNNTLFWKDAWLDNKLLYEKFGRLIMLDSNEDALVSERIIKVPAQKAPTMQNNWLPQKFDIFIWRTLLKILPVRVELDKRGVDLESILHPVCNNEVETV